MSKLSFRARQVDYTKPLPIYLNQDLPDLQDFAAINRAVPQMPTGMEKDEEAEHHLQRALSALQAFGDKSSNDYSIPTPKVEIDNKMYERIYNVECPKHKQYIRIQPFSNDYDYPDYDADYEDENWLAEKKKQLPEDFNEDIMLYFETIMDRLEKATSYSTNLMSLEEAKLILLKDANGNDDHELFGNSNSSRASLEHFILAIYEYWKQKRLKWNHPLTPIVMTDKSGIVTQPNNPYLVFRRRVEKMQTRKNRKNEEQSYEKMLILKRDLCRAQHILKLLKRREMLKKDFLQLTLDTFEKRYRLNDFDGSVAEQIASMLRPPQMAPTVDSCANNTNLLNVNHEKQRLGQNNNHTNSRQEKNLSSIDKTIVNLINSNKLKTLASPPHSSLKKVGHLENDFLVESIYSASDVAKQQKLSEKSRQKKKEKRFREDSSSSATISSLIQLKQQQQGGDSKRLLGDLIDLNGKSRMGVQQQQLKQPSNKLNAHLQSQKQGVQHSVVGRSLNSIDLLKKAHKLSGVELEQLQRRRNNSGTVQISSTPPVTEKSPDEQHQPNNNNKKEETSERDNQLLTILNELKDYEDELRVNQIDNLDAVLTETKSRVSTSSDKDGYWYFKRKEGCKYLPQNGPIFKNDVIEEPTFSPRQPLVEPINTIEPPLPPLQSNNNQVSQSMPPHKKARRNRRKQRLRDLQQFYYGYVVTKQQRHLGLVRRRVGRGGRILMDKFNEDLADCISDGELKPDQERTLQFDFSRFKTYHPADCFDLEDTSKTSELPKKKLKLRNSIPRTEHDEQPPDPSDILYDHHMFPLQLAQDVNKRCQFLDTATEADLTESNHDPQLIASSIRLQSESTHQHHHFRQQTQGPPTTTSSSSLVNLTDPITSFDQLGTDIDFDNLFESDKDDQPAALNMEYRVSSDQLLLTTGAVRLALKTLRPKSRTRSVPKLLTAEAGKSSAESMASITSTTLTPPSPSPPPMPSQQVPVKESASPVGNKGKIFQSLNKVGLNSQFQLHSISPVKKPPETNGAAAPATFASPTYLVKKPNAAKAGEVSPGHFYSTSSSSSPSSSQAINGTPAAAPLMQPSSVIVNGILSKSNLFFKFI